jgi:hypothetical protein
VDTALLVPSGDSPDRQSKIEAPIAGESSDAVPMLQITTGRHEGHFCLF